MNGTIYTATTLAETLYEGDSLYLAKQTATQYALDEHRKTYIQQTKPGQAPTYIWSSSSLSRRRL